MPAHFHHQHYWKKNLGEYFLQRSSNTAYIGQKIKYRSWTYKGIKKKKAILQRQEGTW